MADLGIEVLGGSSALRYPFLQASVPEDTVTVPDPELTDVRSGERLPAQWLRGGGERRLAWTLASLAPGERREFALSSTRLPPGGGLRAESLPGRVAFTLDGAPFTAYDYSENHARPYLYPVLGPGGVSMTRHYPMEDAPGEHQDHPHHRSLWVAHGDLNGADNWSEEEGHAWIRTRAVRDVFGGRVCAGFTADHVWTTCDGEPLMSEERRLTVVLLPGGEWMLDLVSTYRADHGQVVFGDTKEGGLISVRVATSMDVDRGGRIGNSEGGVGEDETWGKQAAWCDYSGMSGGRHVGIALFDHPDNPRFPTNWHVRNYGLMTANPFGLSYFYNSKERNGSMVVPAGDSVTFHYRAFVHAGDASGGHVPEVYAGFREPTRVEVLTGA